MLVPFAHDEIELALRKMRIDQRKWNAMKGEIPRRVPRKLPLVRHRHHTLVVKMTPLGVAGVFAFIRRRREGRIPLEPLLYDVMIKLFTPKHSRQRLALDRAMLRAQTIGCERRVKFVGLARTFRKQIIEVRKRAKRFLARTYSPQAEPNRPASSR